jgi:predicted MarR family transcription regulator
MGEGEGAEYADLREQLDNGDVGMILQRKDQYSVVAQFMRAVTDIKGRPP